MTTPAAPPAPPASSPLRLVGTLAGAGALAGFFLVLAFQVTQPRILAYKAEVLKQAVREVLKEPARFEEREIGGEKVYVGFDKDGARVGYAIVAAAPGFQDTVRLIFGYDPKTRQLLGMKVLESKETPGLGDRIEGEAFLGQFGGAATPLVGIKGGGAGEGIHMITGATISSRAVITMINRALERLGPLLEREEARG
jgi:electron transport complex protein RnfG